MANVNIIGPAFRASIIDSVKIALNSAVQHGDPSTQLSNALIAQDDIMTAVKTALAEEMRHLNSRLSQQNRLPNEVWCNIWELLPDLDCISVSRVCTRWRALVYSTAALWKSFQFYTNCHAARCLCSACQYRTKHTAIHPGGWHSDPYPAAWTNVGWAPEALSRSRALPLRLTVDIAPYLPNEDVTNFLADSLLPHTGRLTSLRLRMCQSGQGPDFLARFDVLPALRVLELEVIGTSPGSSGFADRSHFISREIELPALEELHLLAPNHTWRPSMKETSWPPIPTVRRLTAHVEEFSGMLHLLRSFPSIIALKLHLWSSSGHHNRDRERELRKALKPMTFTSVELLHLSDPEGPRWLSKAFKSSTLQHFALCFSTMYRSVTPWALLDELGDGIALSCSRTLTSFDVRATDCTERVRRLWRAPEYGYSGSRYSPDTAQCFTGEFWLPWERIVSLAIDATGWVPLVSKIQQWPRVETLRISFSPGPAQTGVPQELAGKASFPALRSVRVDVLTHGLCIEAETVASYLRVLRLDAPVSHLTLDGKVEGYDVQLFFGLAERVTFT